MSKRTLTAAAVARIKPPATGQQEHFDAALPGFALRITDKGRRSWTVHYRVQAGPEKGKQRRYTIGAFPIMGLADAREAARDALQRVASGCDPVKERQREAAAPAATADTFDDIARQFIDKHAKRHTRSWRETERILDNYVSPKWGRKPIGDIAKRDVIELMDEMMTAPRRRRRTGYGDQGTPYMANRVFAAIRKLFNWAIERDIVDASPVAGIKPPAKEVSRDRTLTDGELLAVWNACDDLGQPFGPIVRLLILTAQRCNEVGRMRWRDIDQEARAWTVPAEISKNGQANVLPLGDMALEVLAALPKGKPADYVFASHGKSGRAVSGYSGAKARLDRLIVAALAQDTPEGEDQPALEPWRFHDLRRTAATALARLGVGQHIVERMLNHRSGTISGVAAVYNRYGYEAEKKEALERWEGHLRALLGRDCHNVVSLNRAG